MRVLVIGSGAREHALCEAISRSPLLTRLWCAPGNAGTQQLAENLTFAEHERDALVAFAAANKVDLVIPGPEAPLVAGIVDAMQEAGVACFGPTAAAAKLEASKRFTKELCREANLPTAAWRYFDDPRDAREYVENEIHQYVIKADGLAGGKGVIVAPDKGEALAVINDFMNHRVLGEAGSGILIEECLRGDEVSFFALCDGKDAIPFGCAQDHKRIGEFDVGLNTGGMGAFTPTPLFDENLQNEAMERIVRPALRVMVERGTPFRGILFAGLMVTPLGLRLIEFNVRFGDPECQTILLLLDADLLEIIYAATHGKLQTITPRWRDQAAMTVVMASPGYPERPRTGLEIRGLDRVKTAKVFHAGTKIQDGRLVTTGGRVLSICATGRTLRDARDCVYAAINQIDWPEGYYRRDIGRRALRNAT